jgi:hypothetical protein
MLASYLPPELVSGTSCPYRGRHYRQELTWAAVARKMLNKSIHLGAQDARISTVVASDGSVGVS